MDKKTNQPTGFALGSIEGRVAIQYVQPTNPKDNFTFKCHRSNGTTNGMQDIYAVRFFFLFILAYTFINVIWYWIFWKYAFYIIYTHTHTLPAFVIFFIVLWNCQRLGLYMNYLCFYLELKFCFQAFVLCIYKSNKRLVIKCL